MTITHSYHDHLTGLYAPVQPASASAPELLIYNEALAQSLGIEIPKQERANTLGGGVTPDWAKPIAQAYAGHQFGHFNPQLGDGRALLLGEVIKDDQRFDIQLKGSGRTPFSRNGDGKAALGPVLREYLVAEAMHALGVPTTRALAAVKTGDRVQRERGLPGAVVTRIASSHIRIGTFQFFAAREDVVSLKRLIDYTIQRHDPDCAGDYFAFFENVLDRQARLIAKWISLGFIHGVMNTDNMAISGETIDYGPCAFMDAYDPDTVFSSIDHGGRYRYANQPHIATWNLARLAEAILPLLPTGDESIQRLTDLLESFAQRYEAYWLAEFRAKLGLSRIEEGDHELINDFLASLQVNQSDFTQSFRKLAQGQAPDLDWLMRYHKRLESEENPQALIEARNPIYIPRNHLVEEALSSAETGDLAPFKHLHELTTHPFRAQSGQARFEAPADRPDPSYRTFCGT